MPLFYFDIRNGFGFTPDEEGRELPDADEARRKALEGARSLLSAEVLQGKLDLRGRIEVTDERRQFVLAVPFGEAVSVLQGEPPAAPGTGSGR